MSDQFCIEDGYERDGYIEAVAGVHPALAFRYRPALMEQRIMWLKATGDASEQVRIAAVIVEKHVLNWSAIKSSGEKIPIKPEWIKRLQPSLLDRLLNVLLGYAGSDAEKADLGNLSAA